mmetsp:Transcript_17666/g.30687  ORF Transcript_17666/g.30687 Transcript_17666/m.30687 type:complete len:529 (-) Transcript_17666:348-1934(-)
MARALSTPSPKPSPSSTESSPLSKWILIGTSAILATTTYSVIRMYYIHHKLTHSERKPPKSLHALYVDPVPEPVDEEKKSEIGTDLPLPILGNSITLSQGFYSSMYKFINSPLSIFWVGTKPFIVLNNLTDVRKALSGAKGLYGKPRYFGYRSQAIQAAVSSQNSKVQEESMELTPGDHSRHALEELIASRFVWLQKSMDEVATYLAEQSIMAFSSSQTQEPIFASVQHSMVSLNLKLLYEYDNPEHAEKISHWISKAGEEFALRMANPFRIYYNWVANMLYFYRVFGLIRMGRILCKHLDQVSELTPAWVNAWLGKVGKVGKLGKVVGLLMASTQTVPLSAIWTLYLVGTDTRVKAKLIQEMKQKNVWLKDDSGPITVDQLNSLAYMEQVVLEALRLYPPFPVLQRQAEQEDVLNDGCMVIPAGTIVYIVPWVIHHNPKIWPNPEEFRPERFENSHSHGDAENDYAFIPFGRGSRMCAGYRLALTEVKLLLVSLLSRYDWTIDYNKPEFPYINMVPQGMKIRFTRLN